MFKNDTLTILLMFPLVDTGAVGVLLLSPHPQIQADRHWISDLRGEAILA